MVGLTISLHILSTQRLLVISQQIKQFVPWSISTSSATITRKD